MGKVFQLLSNHNILSKFITYNLLSSQKDFSTEIYRIEF